MPKWPYGSIWGGTMVSFPGSLLRGGDDLRNAMPEQKSIVQRSKCAWANQHAGGRISGPYRYPSWTASPQEWICPQAPWPAFGACSDLSFNSRFIRREIPECWRFLAAMPGTRLRAQSGPGNEVLLVHSQIHSSTQPGGIEPRGHQAPHHEAC